MKNKSGGVFWMEPKWLLCTLCAAASLLIVPGRLSAQLVTLSDGGSSATVDVGSSAGMNSWNLQGQNQLQQQWFWYSVNGGPVQAINALGGLSYSQDGHNNFLDVSYGNSQLSVDVQYALTSLGAQSADMSETLAVNNLSGQNINSLKFYQFSHFNLLQSGNNSVQIFGSPGNYSYVQQTSGATAIQEAITSPSATAAEAAYYNQTLVNFAGNNGYDLNNNQSAGPGDVTWSFEWSQSLGAGQELDIFKDKTLSISPIPEPSTLGLLAVGVGALGCRLLRRRN
jgi:hypothetical protein